MNTENGLEPDTEATITTDNHLSASQLNTIPRIWREPEVDLAIFQHGLQNTIQNADLYLQLRDHIQQALDSLIKLNNNLIECGRSFLKLGDPSVMSVSDTTDKRRETTVNKHNSSLQ